jgi:alpha-beta hydrolase superfamily lysophospholipase
LRPRWDRAAQSLGRKVKNRIGTSVGRSIVNWRSPVLLMHGDDDRNVPFQQTTDLVKKPHAQKVESLPM